MKSADGTRVKVFLMRRSRVLFALLGVTLMASLPRPVFGQWTTGSGGAIYYSGGKVGVGTTGPTAQLDVYGTSTGLRVNSWTDLSASACGLALWGNNVYLNNADNTYRFSNSHSGIGATAIQFNICGGDTNDILFLRATGATTAGAVTGMSESMRINASGNVGIGTTAPQYKLAVNGTIGTKEVVVTNSGWADYVFKPSYYLRPLTEVAAYIDQFHHLPEIPSEGEIQEKGVGLGEMQVKLLAKIEELTLHVIQADEKNRQLQERIARLESRGIK